MGSTALVDQERALYSDVWTSLDQYGSFSPGKQAAGIFYEIVGGQVGTVLDAGCGKGEGAAALDALGFTVACCDITDAAIAPGFPFFFQTACLWDDLAPLAFLAQIKDPAFSAAGFEYVFCCDVLEHIPKGLTMLTVARLLAVAKRGLFLNIAFIPDHFGVWVGQHLHKTIEPFTWWRDTLQAVGTVVEARDCLASGIFYLTGRGVR